jgi:hypothetical protein
MMRFARRLIVSALVVVSGLIRVEPGLPQTATELREAAVLKARAGHIGEAQKELRAMLAAGNGDNGLVAMDLTTLLQQDRKPREAVAVFEKAAPRSPGEIYHRRLLPCSCHTPVLQARPDFCLQHTVGPWRRPGQSRPDRIALDRGCARTFARSLPAIKEEAIELRRANDRLPDQAGLGRTTDRGRLEPTIARANDRNRRYPVDPRTTAEGRFTGPKVKSN